ncbi:MAG: hypothetical protein K5871_08815 [Lachnospiraceae bacterium]|nr:hypothetical protein [Lachnospiraceae bacterium]
MGKTEKTEKIENDIKLTVKDGRKLEKEKGMGKDHIPQFLHEIMDIDDEVYTPINPNFKGELVNLNNRYQKNKDTFICLMDGDTIAGYINFFPVCDKLLDQILGPVDLPDTDDKDGYDPEGFIGKIYKDGRPDEDKIVEHYKSLHGNTVWVKEDDDKKTKPIEKPANIDTVTYFYNLGRDDDITPDEIHAKYDTEKVNNNLFVISVVVREAYRNSKHPGLNASKMLSDAFVEFLNDLDHKGTPVNSVSAMCITEGGERFMRSMNFYFHRELGLEEREFQADNEHPVSGLDAIGSMGVEKPYHERVYLCWGYYLDCLIEGRVYHKTHKDDIYLFVPLAENPENSRIDDLFEANSKYEDNYYYPGEIPSDSAVKNTKKLLDELQGCIEYEYDGFIKKELKRIYLGEVLFRHSTDRYAEDIPEDGESVAGETVGEDKADLLLLAYPSANMYVLVIYLPNCKYSSSMVGDQLSKMKLERRAYVDAFGFFEYELITDLLREKYNLIRCGNGKAFYCMNELPKNCRFVSEEEKAEIAKAASEAKEKTEDGKETSDEKNDAGEDKDDDKQELMNILTGETFFSVHQDFYIKKYDKLKEQMKTNLAIYDYYEAYMSPVSLVIKLKTYGDIEQRIEDVATYVFIVELVLLQNTALTKLSSKVGNALEHEGDVPNEYISRIYKEFGKTLKLWDASNFKYYGTRMEAEQIRMAFENDELREKYEKEQEFLENIVEVNTANEERMNNWIIGIVGTVLAVFQIKDYLIEIFGKFFVKLGDLTGYRDSIIPPTDAGFASVLDGMFNVVVWGAVFLLAMIYPIDKNRKKFEQERNLHLDEEDVED